MDKRVVVYCTSGVRCENSRVGWCVKATKMLVNCMVESPLMGKDPEVQGELWMENVRL